MPCYLQAGNLAAAVAPGKARAASELKAELLQAVSHANSAGDPKETHRLQQRVEDLAVELAACNPTPDAATSQLISGRQGREIGRILPGRTQPA